MFLVIFLVIKSETNNIFGGISCTDRALVNHCEFVITAYDY